MYPHVALKQARERRDDTKRLLANGVDPSEQRKATKAAVTDRAANSFEAIAREWFAMREKKWAKGHSDKVLQRLEHNIFPYLGGRPIAEVTSREFLAVLRRIEARGAIETAHRTKQHVVTKCALRLAPLTFVRPGELRQGEWTEFNLDKAEWRIPAARMKMREQHIVPLSTHAVAVLKELQPLTARGKYVSVNAALRNLGYSKDQMTGHGFRSMASTHLNEQGWNRDAIERQLAHAERDAA